MKITSKKIMGIHRLSQRSKIHKPGRPPKVSSAGEDGVIMEFEMDGCSFRIELDHSEAGSLLGGLAWGIDAGLKYLIEAQKNKESP